MIDQRWVTVFTAGGELPFEADRYPLGDTLLSYEQRLLPLIHCRDCGFTILRVYHLPPSATVGTVIAAVLRHEADHHRGDTDDQPSQEDSSEQKGRSRQATRVIPAVRVAGHEAGRHRSPDADRQG